MSITSKLLPGCGVNQLISSVLTSIQRLRFSEAYNGIIVEYAIFTDEHSKRNIEIIICKHTYETKSMLFSTDYSQRHKIDSMLIVLLIAHILMPIYE